MAEILSRILAALVFAGIAGGLTSVLLTAFGDRTAMHEKRLSCSPFNHLALSGIFLAIAFETSWFRALPIERGRRAIRPIAAALLAMVLVLALVPLLDLIRSPLHAALPRTIGHFTLASLDNLQELMVNSVVLGLLPLPGLWLGSMLPAALPRLEKRWRKGMGWGLSLAAIVMILGWFPSTAALLEWLQLV